MPKGRRDVQLWFDQETHRLAKTVAWVKDDNGNEITEETLMSDYSEVHGTMHAMRFAVFQNGKPYFDGELTEFRLCEKLDVNLFEMP